MTAPTPLVTLLEEEHAEHERVWTSGHYGAQGHYSCKGRDCSWIGSSSDAHRAHLASVQTARVSEWLDGEGIWEYVTTIIGDERDKYPRLSTDADSGEIADAVLAALRGLAQGGGVG